VRASGRLPDDQAEIVYSDIFVEQLGGLTEREREDVVVATVGLWANPSGSHTLSAAGRDRALVGWNTLEVLQRSQRVVFHVDEPGSSILVLCIGPRRGAEVYDLAGAMARSGALTDAEVNQLWDALTVLEMLAEKVGLDGWDYRPDPAPEGQRCAVVASGLVEEAFARLLSKDELFAAMEHGWGTDGRPDPDRALAAALRRARGGAGFDSAALVIEQRAADRCGAAMPRAGARCIRRSGHPGPHRATP
jgi:hypothetical protein